MFLIAPFRASASLAGISGISGGLGNFGLEAHSIDPGAGAVGTLARTKVIVWQSFWEYFS
jgi:hypothetical protein